MIVNSALVNDQVLVTCTFNIATPNAETQKKIADFGMFAPNWDKRVNKWTIHVPTGHPQAIKAIRIPEDGIYGVQVKKNQKIQLEYTF